MAPAPTPGSLDAARRAPTGSLVARAALARRRRRPAPREAAGAGAGGAVEGVGAVARELATPAPRDAVRAAGPDRRVRDRLLPSWRIQRGRAATVNDVLLAVAHRCLAPLPRAPRDRTDGLELRALVPVSSRPARRGELGNRLATCARRCRWHSPTRAARLAGGARGWTRSKVRAGARRRRARRRSRARAAAAARAARRPNVAPRLFNLLDHERPRSARAALRPRPAHDRGLPVPAAAARPGARAGDPVLRRTGQLRPARRPPRAAGARPLRRLGAIRVDELVSAGGGGPQGPRAPATTPPAASPRNSPAPPRAERSQVLAQQREGDRGRGARRSGDGTPAAPSRTKPSRSSARCERGLRTSAQAAEALHPQRAEDEVGDQRLAASALAPVPQ